MADATDDVYHGGCHCGALTFTAKRTVNPTRILECSCDYCKMTGFQVSTSLPAGNIETTSDWTATSVDYKPAGHKLSHRFCSKCGNTVATVRDDGAIDAVNVRMMLPDVPANSLPVEEVPDGCEAGIQAPASAAAPPERLEDDRWRYRGMCHCGAVTYKVETARITSALDHSCSICSRNGYLWRYPLKGERTVLTGEENLTKYQFGRRFAGHMFCKTCGAKLFNFLSDEDAPIAPVNVRTVGDLGLTEPLKREAQVVEAKMPDGSVVRRVLERDG